MDEETETQRLSELIKRLETENEKQRNFIKKIENSYGSIEKYKEFLGDDPREKYPYMSRTDFEAMMAENNKYL